MHVNSRNSRHACGRGVGQRALSYNASRPREAAAPLASRAASNPLGLPGLNGGDTAAVAERTAPKAAIKSEYPKATNGRTTQPGQKRRRSFTQGRLVAPWRIPARTTTKSALIFLVRRRPGAPRARKRTTFTTLLPHLCSRSSSSSAAPSFAAPTALLFYCPSRSRRRRRRIDVNSRRPEQRRLRPPACQLVIHAHAAQNKRKKEKQKRRERRCGGGLVFMKGQFPPASFSFPFCPSSFLDALMYRSFLQADVGSEKEKKNTGAPPSMCTAELFRTKTSEPFTTTKTSDGDTIYASAPDSAVKARVDITRPIDERSSEEFVS